MDLSSMPFDDCRVDGTVWIEDSPTAAKSMLLSPSPHRPVHYIPHTGSINLASQLQSKMRSQSVAQTKQETSAKLHSLLGGVSDFKITVAQIAGTLKGQPPAYTVRTEVAEQEFAQATTLEVRRSFSDFEQLHRLVKETSRGFFLPAPPSKVLVDAPAGKPRAHPAKSTAHLQAYVSAVAWHPVLRCGEPLTLFLSHPGDLPACPRWGDLLRRPAGDGLRALLSGIEPGVDSGSGNSGKGNSPSAAAAAARGGGLAGRLGRGGSGGCDGVDGGIAGLSYTSLRCRQPSLGGLALREAKMPLTAQEAHLRRSKDMLKEVNGHISEFSAAARSMASHAKALCNDLGAMGRGLAAIASCQGFGPGLGGGQRPRGQVSQAAVECPPGTSKALEVLQQQIEAGLAFLQGWQALVPEAILALEEREGALAAVDLIREELADCEAAAIAASRSKGGRTPKGLDRKPEFVQLQSRLSSAQLHYDLLLTRNLAEMERVRLEHADDFGDVLTQLARAQRNMAAAFVQALSAAAGMQQGPGA